MPRTLCSPLAIAVLLAGFTQPVDAWESLGKTLDRTRDKAKETAGDICGSVCEEAARIRDQAAREAARVRDQAEEEAIRVRDQAEHEAANALSNLGEGVEVAAKTTERNLRNVRDSTLAAVEHALDGHLGQAYLELTVEQWKRTDENYARAVQESSLLRAVAQVAATAYGGPKGSAAFSAWYAHHSDADIETVARVAAISYGTSAAMGGVKGIPAEHGVARVVAAGAVGAGASHAAGGDETAVRKAFFLAAGMQLGQDQYAQLTGKNLDARSSEGDPTCKGLEGRVCSPNDSWKPGDDVRTLPETIPHVGMASSETTTGSLLPWKWDSRSFALDERSGIMSALSRVPGMNPMAYAHDIWTGDLGMGSPMLQVTIMPFIVGTYIATGAPLEQELTDTALAAE